MAQPRSQADRNSKVLFLCNELDFYKKQIYDVFRQELAAHAETDLQVYHNSARYFVQLALKAKNTYSHYAIVPNFYDDPTRCYKLINQIPKDKLVLLRSEPEAITGDYSAVREDFFGDILKTLRTLKTHILKYQRLVLLFSRQEFIADDTVKGIVHFCKESHLPCAMLTEISAYHVCKGDVFLVVSDAQLMLLVNEITRQQLTPGSDIGVISCHENESKKFILNGLTTVSTNFPAMGTSSAKIIISKERQRIVNPYYITFRKSL